MGGRGGHLGSNHSAPAVTPIPALKPTVAQKKPQPAQQQAPVASGPPTGKVFPDLTIAQQAALLQAQRPKQTQAALLAIRDYTDPNQQSNGYALSQNTNRALESGRKLLPNQKRMVDGLKQIMGPIGAETTLYRADHESLLKQLGVSNYASLTTAQLRQALVGQSWTTKGFTSTAHTARMNPFWPGGSAGGGREVLMKVHTGKGLRGALVQRAQAELLLDTGTHFRITAVRATGTYAHPRTGGHKPVIEIEAEAW